MTLKHPPLVLVALLMGCATTWAPVRAVSEAEHADAARWAVFEPQTARSDDWVDYTVLDELLARIVLSTGMSLRRRQPPPPRMTGTRIVRGATSPLRLEGNKVVFSRMDDDTQRAVRAYADALIEVGNKLRIPELARNEQLAFWLNLHNVLVIAEIASNYPVRKPSRMRLAGEWFHDAKLATIADVPLSLRDIRVNIVQRYWIDPRVMYGFFRGDLAGPSILPRAWRPSNLARGLSRNAREFINALRGVDRVGRHMVVSPVYLEAKEQLFPGWPDDFRRHLRAFAEPPVLRILDETDRIELGRYEASTADLVGGDAFGSMSRIEGLNQNPRGFNAGVQVPIGRPATTFNYGLIELQRKMNELRRRGRRRPTVRIDDAPFRRSEETIE